MPQNALFKKKITGMLGALLMDVGSGGDKHGTNIVDRGLKVLFFSLFCYFSVFFPLPPPPLKKTK